MNKINRELDQATESDLERVIEPLASFICATEQPRAALMSALAILFSEVRADEQGGKRAFRNLLGESLVMKYMLLIYIDEHALTEAEREHCYDESTQLAQELQRERAVSGRQPVAPDVDGDQRPGARRQTARHRRSVRRDARTARRLLPDRRQGSRRGDRHRRADSRGAHGHRRNPAGHGDSGPADRLMSSDGPSR